MDIADFLFPIEPAVFRKDYFGKRPLVIKAGAKRFGDLVTWSDLERLVNDVSHVHRLEIIGDDRQKVKPTDYAQGAPVWRRHYIDKARIADHWARGSTFILLDMGHTNEAISDVFGAIEREFEGCEADGHVYFSRSEGSKSFNFHSDFPHNFIVQIAGQTEWRVFAESGANPSKQELPAKAAKLTTEIETVLSEGDILYVPPLRYYEEVRALGPRVVLTIPFVEPRGAPVCATTDVKTSGATRTKVDRTRIKLTR